MPNIVIESFQWGQANDKNRGQAWAFWNAKNIDYRKNSAYIELNKKVDKLFSVSAIPLALTLWWNGWTLATDVVAFCNNGIYKSVLWVWTLQTSLSTIYNVATANNKKYVITDNDIYEYTNPTTVTLLVTYSAHSSWYRPAIDFGWDLIIGNGNKVIRYNIDGTLIEWTAWTTQPVIGWLDWVIVAITNIGQWLYIWCDGETSTTMYQWDGVSNSWSTYIRYADKSVRNVALLGNRHYWWQSKTDSSIKEVIIGESYIPQVFMKSDYPNVPLDSNPDDEKNKMAINVWWANAYQNAIETIGDIVYFPWTWRIFGFGSYYPWDKYSFNTEFTFTGTAVTAMTSWGITGSWSVDAWWILVFGCANWGSNYDINAVNLWMEATFSPWYATTGEIESMEYIASNYAKWEDDVKYLIDFELPDSSCSIDIYEKRNRGSYTLVKSLSYTDYPWHNLAEIATQGNWRRKQFKFVLNSSDSLYSPKLYTGFTNVTKETWRT